MLCHVLVCVCVVCIVGGCRSRRRQVSVNCISAFQTPFSGDLPMSIFDRFFVCSDLGGEFDPPPLKCQDQIAPAFSPLTCLVLYGRWIGNSLEKSKLHVFELRPSPGLLSLYVLQCIYRERGREYTLFKPYPICTTVYIQREGEREDTLFKPYPHGSCVSRVIIYTPSWYTFRVNADGRGGRFLHYVYNVDGRGARFLHYVYNVDGRGRPQPPKWESGATGCFGASFFYIMFIM